jgi:crotonobetainyl-CoA:carnitine CoA-transferase CaiB-like acyl-CoA transferase
VQVGGDLGGGGDSRWNLSMHVGERDRRYLRPFMKRYGLAEGITELVSEPVPGVRPVAGALSAATAGVEYVQRLTRRFTYAGLPLQEAQLAGLLWSPVRKPHENADDQHWLSRGTFADVAHPELDQTFRYPVSKWISTRGSWGAGRRAPLLGEDDKLLRDGWLPSDSSLGSSRTSAGSSHPVNDTPATVGKSGIMLTQVPVLDWSANGRAWERSGNRAVYAKIAPQGIYRCAGDDRWIAITCATSSQWQALASAAGHGEWLADPRFLTVADRLAHHDDLDALLSSWTAGFEPYSLMTKLQAAGVPAGVCQTAADRCDNDPQLRHLGWLTELTGTRIGRWPLAEVPVRMSRTPPYLGGRPDRAAPLYGEDNMAILTGLLGLSAEEVAELTEQGVL